MGGAVGGAAKNFAEHSEPDCSTGDENHMAADVIERGDLEGNSSDEPYVLADPAEGVEKGVEKRSTEPSVMDGFAQGNLQCEAAEANNEEQEPDPNANVSLDTLTSEALQHLAGLQAQAAVFAEEGRDFWFELG